MCKARRYGDQYHCHACGFQWDVDDEDRPMCNDRFTDAKRKAAERNAVLPSGSNYRWIVGANLQLMRIGHGDSNV